jgi:hypothetical protein
MSYQDRIETAHTLPTVEHQDHEKEKSPSYTEDEKASASLEAGKGEIVEEEYAAPNVYVFDIRCLPQR